MNFGSSRLSRPFALVTLNSFFTALGCVLITLFSLKAFDTSDWTPLNYGYWTVFALTNFFLIAWVPGLLLGWIPLKMKCPKTAFTLLALLNGILLSWALADAFVFEQFRLHINLPMVQMTLLGGGKIVPFTAAVYIKSALLIAGCFVLGALFVKAAGALSLRIWAKTVAALCLLSWVLCMLWGGYAYATHRSAYLESAEVLPAAKILHFNKILVKLHVISEKDFFMSFDNGGKKKFNYPQAPLACSGGKRTNILFIYVDSLRYDMLQKETMPAVAAFAKDNIVFNDHWSGGINTRHGIFTLFTGIPGSYWSKSLATKSSSALIDALQLQKYNIGIFASAPLTMPEFNQTVFAKIPNLRLESKGKGVLDEDADALKDFYPWLKSQKEGEPFFGFVFLNNVHGAEFPESSEKQPFEPYWEKVDHMQLKPDFDPKPYFNRYKNAVRYADKNISAILETLKKDGLLDNTIVVISSDHGEEFNDNRQNYWGHNGNFTKFQAKIPLVIHWPGKSAQTVTHRTSALDIVPTLLTEVLGCSNPVSDYSSGRSLWNTSERPFVFVSNYSRNALVEPDQITQIDEKGVLTVTDSHNRKITSKPAPDLVREFFSETTRFFK